MGCTQSRDVVHQQTERPLLPQSRVPSTVINRSRRSLSQILISHSLKQNSNRPSMRPVHGSHRDVFSIFAERGMTLEPDHEETTTVASYLITDGLLYSPSSDDHTSRSSAYSTATTASEQNDRSSVRAPHGHVIPSLQLSYGVYSDKGIRKQNEDRSVCTSQMIHGQPVAFFGVYDGHGGVKVAEYLTKHLHQAVFDQLRQQPSASSMKPSIEQAFAITDDAIFTKEMESGSTACTVMIRDRQIVIANVGDSQAILCSSGKARAISKIHTPDGSDEKKRILAANGVVTKGRIFGLLSVSRSFGDNDFKTSRGEFKEKFQGDLVIATPDCMEFDMIPEDEFLIVACDGLYEVMQPQQVIDFVRAKLVLHGDVQHACEELNSYAISIGSTDNVSVIIISLHQAAKEVIK